ncbi:TrkA family potassium uptake protein [Caldibacillus lycopersici]|uniref:TrkA family potassium uptake protein n=1 Tax=Perspicuibacillus lycopersici TaxID=1325689 RepID=A0AAE3LRF8_9BACI|nr:TrkA family potassium uptake protein [Perspicuibacillus lycopersici]MCU9614604.1 TrkA family potassium uptake protein [Perspicuibacillus lycopersici]
MGLGRFGRSICKELYHLGHEVLVVDMNEDKVNYMSDYCTHAAIANASDEKALKSLGVRNFDYAIVAIGDNIQASILCTLLLKELGVKEVWVKARDTKHQKVLEKIGADRIIHPEKDMGVRIARQLNSNRVIDFIELSEDYSIIELIATKKINNKSLEELDIRLKYDCTIIAIKREDEVTVSPSPSAAIYQGDTLVVIGKKDNLKRFEEKGM